MTVNEMISGKLTTIKDKLDIFPFANDAVVIGALIGLSYIGIALTNVSPQTSRLYWAIMIPVFGAISPLGAVAAGAGGPREMESAAAQRSYSIGSGCGWPCS